jgi:hypothetical protein
MTQEDDERAENSVTSPQGNPGASSGLEGHVDAAIGQPAAGSPVYDLTGEKVGSVTTVNLPNGYFTLEKGVVFTRDFYIPLSAVERMSPDAIHLNVDKDQMAYLGWDARPDDDSTDNASSLNVEDEDR